MKIWINDTRIEKSYKDICTELGFMAKAHFIKVNTAGTITFTVGAPHEIRSLYYAILNKGMRPSKALANTIKNL
jgi:hypothetical protein